VSDPDTISPVVRGWRTESSRLEALAQYTVVEYLAALRRLRITSSALPLRATRRSPGAAPR
jgi:hypothetical protein